MIKVAAAEVLLLQSFAINTLIGQINHMNICADRLSTSKVMTKHIEAWVVIFVALLILLHLSIL